MTTLRSGMVVDIHLDPVQGSEPGKTRPGELDAEKMRQIDAALRVVFAL
jgi:mRNA-degrading endonuclease toxin of MazEF toxin-antitoxin module